MKRYRTITLALAIMLALGALTAYATSYNSLTAPVAAKGGKWRYFPETGHNLSGDFRWFWENRGGRRLFGWPITEPFEENGKWVQYFERVRMELRPEATGEARVVIGQLGREVLQAHYPANDPLVQSHNPQTGETWRVGNTGTWRVVLFWTTEPYYPQTERKLILAPGENPALKGGGSFTEWQPGEASQAYDFYSRQQKPAVSLTTLFEEGLVQAP